MYFLFSLLEAKASVADDSDEIRNTVDAHGAIHAIDLKP